MLGFLIGSFLFEVVLGQVKLYGVIADVCCVIVLSSAHYLFMGALMIFLYLCFWIE